MPAMRQRRRRTFCGEARGDGPGPTGRGPAGIPGTAATAVGVPGITTPVVRADDVATYWKYALLVDPALIPGGPQALAAELRVGGIASAPRYIQKPAFECRVFTEQRTFGSSRWPFSIARPEALVHPAERCTGTRAFLDNVLVLPWNERYEARHVELLADAIRASVLELMERR